MHPQSLILITVDCFRADHAGFLGYQRPITPFLDGLACKSAVFENAIAAGAPTYYSVPAILASRHPLALGRDVLGIAPGENTIASLLQESGFATAAFSAGNPYLSPRFGYDNGFDVFLDFLQGRAGLGAEVLHDSLRSRANRLLSRACHSIGSLGAAYDELYFRYCQVSGTDGDLSLDSHRRYPSADVIVDHAIRWLEKHSGQRFFLWLHLMDAHAPYYPKPEALDQIGVNPIGGRQAVYLNSYWNRGDLGVARLQGKKDEVVSLYDAGIRWVDEQIRRLADSLRHMNAWDRCALAVTADHGEEFLDHSGRFHQPRKLTEELIRVPLVLRVPGEPARRLVAPFSLIDLTPTLVDVLGIPSPSDFRGSSAWGQLRRGELKQRAVISECVYNCTNPFHVRDRSGPRLLAVRHGPYKLVLDFESGAIDLYNLNRDPGENTPIPVNELTDVRKELLQHARKHLVESCKSRDFDRRIASQVREFRLELARSAAPTRAN